MHALCSEVCLDLCSEVCFDACSFTASHFCLTLDVLYHTIPHQLCRCEVKDVHGLQSFVSTRSEESDSLLFILWLQ